MPDPDPQPPDRSLDQLLQYALRVSRRYCRLRGVIGHLEDVAQAVLLEALERLERRSDDPDAVPGRLPPDLEAALDRAANRLSQRYRRRRLRERSSIEPVPTSDSVTGPASDAAVKEAVEAVGDLVRATLVRVREDQPSYAEEWSCFFSPGTAPLAEPAVPGGRAREAFREALRELCVERVGGSRLDFLYESILERISGLTKGSHAFVQTVLGLRGVLQAPPR